MLQSPEPLSAAHVLDGFDSGVATLDEWLRKRALRNQTSGVSRTFVACETGRVVADCALAASAIATESAPGRFRRNMPDPIPVVVLGRPGATSSITGTVARRWLEVDVTPYFQQTGTMNEKAAVASLAALAQGMRLRIFRALIGAAPEGMTPGVLSATLDLPGSTLSFHLKELMHAGLVSQQREGRNLIYRPSIDQMNALLAYLTAHCCQGAACAAKPGRRRVTC
jgi:ArsR family transcriptional regulator